MTLTYNKNVVFTVQAADTLNSPSSTQAFTFSNLAPGIGESITVTPPAGIVFTAGTKVTFDSLGPVPHYTVAGDGSSIAMVAGPNSVGPTTFTNVANPANPSFTFTLKSADTLKSAGVSVFEATADKANAAANEPVTFTGSSSNYKFDVFNSLLFVNGTPALLSSVTADSSSAVVLPRPGTTGGSSYLLSPLVAGFLLDSLPISGNGPTVAALGASQAGTDDFGTAPTINAPGVGEAVAFWDGAPYGHTSAAALGSASDRLYKLVVPADGSFRFALPYISDGSDLGIYFYRDDATHSLITSFFADDLGAGGAESADIDLDAGTYYMAVVHFHYTTAASLFGLNIIGLEPEE